MLVRTTNKEKGILEYSLEVVYYFCDIVKNKNMQ